jgi:peptidoglycan/xylan/chitin deacetylase (PgdA/CDA1 family)
MYLPIKLFLNVILLATLTVVVDVSAQDQGPGFIKTCTTPGQVALTFDDGPSSFTPKLLGYLKTAKVPATFFVLGKSINGKGGKEALKATYDAGHQIALHSNTHADMNTLTPAKIKDEYEINIKFVRDTIGVQPLIAR